MHARTVDVKGCSGEIPDGNEDYVTGNRSKGNYCHKVAQNLAALCLRRSVSKAVEKQLGYS